MRLSLFMNITLLIMVAYKYSEPKLSKDDIQFQKSRSEYDNSSDVTLIKITLDTMTQDFKTSLSNQLHQKLQPQMMKNKLNEASHQANMNFKKIAESIEFLKNDFLQNVTLNINKLTKKGRDQQQPQINNSNLNNESQTNPNTEAQETNPNYLALLNITLITIILIILLRKKSCQEETDTQRK
jgi:hypothetical protein